MLTKNHLIEGYRDTFNASRGDSEKVIDWLFETITGELAKPKGEMNIRDFGSLYATKQAARVGRNPRTGEEIAIPEKTAVKFKAGRGLAATVNGG